MTLKSFEKNINQSKLRIGQSLLIGLGGVGFVGLCSYISLFLDKITDEWFSFLTFVLLWIYIFVRLISNLINNRDKIKVIKNKDYPLLIFWFAMYIYCICGLIKLEIIQALPLYGAFAIFLFIITLFLAIVEIKNEKNVN